jgi:hypothetical protein
MLYGKKPPDWESWNTPNGQYRVTQGDFRTKTMWTYLHAEAIFRLGLLLKSCHGWKDHMIEPLRMVRRLTTRERKPGKEPGNGDPGKSTAKGLWIPEMLELRSERKERH